MFGRLIKYFGYFIAVLVALVCGLAFFTQTGLFKNWLRDALIHQVNANLNGQLSIGAIHGNILRDFEISDLHLISEADTIIDLERIQVNFTPIGLIHKQLIVRVLSLQAPCLRLKQMPDSTWNLAHLVKSADTAPDSGKPLDWQFRFQNVRVSRGCLKILPLTDVAFLPDQIQDIEARLSFQIHQDTIQASLKQFSLRSVQPDLEIRELAFDFNLRGDRFQFLNLKLATGKSLLAGQATLDLSSGNSVSLTLAANPIDFSEIRLFVPDLAPIQPTHLNLTADYWSDSLKLASTIVLKGQSVAISGQADGLADHPHYSFVLDLDQVQLSDWIADPALDYLLNGQIRLKGAGMNLNEAILSLESELKNCQILDRRLNSARLVADYRTGQVNSRVTIGGLFGRLDMDAWFDLSKSQRFRLAATGEQINLARLFLNDSLNSAINFQLVSEGQGFDLDRLNARADLHLVRSKLLRLPVDTLFARVRADQGIIAIDTLYALTSPASVQATGTVSAALDYDLQVTGYFSALDWLKAFVSADSLNGQGRVKARISGRKDSVMAETNFDFARMFFNTIRADSVTGNFYVAVRGDSLNGTAQASLNKIKFGEIPVDFISAQSIVHQDKFRFFVEFSQSSEISGHFEALLRPDSVSYVHLPNLMLNIKNSQWSCDSTGVELFFAPDLYRVRNACLRSGAQFIQVQGALAPEGIDDLTLKISRLDLEPFLNLGGVPSLQQAVLDLDAHLGGTMADPRLNGEMSLNNGRIQGIDFDYLKARFNYSDQQLNWQVKLRQSKMQGLESEGFIPINLALTETGERLIYQKPFQVRIAMDTLNLKALEALSDQIRVQGGSAFGKLTLDNTLDNIRPAGELKVNAGELRLPRYGIHYRDIQMMVKIDSSKLSLQNFRTKSERGFLTATGFMDFDRNILNGEFKSTQLKLAADQFTVVNNRELQVTLGADLTLAGPVRTPELDGEIRILRSRLYLPAFMRNGTSEEEWDRPLLMQSLPDTKKVRDVPSEISFPDIFDNLKVNASVEIPRNTWLKSPEINLEIAGELTVIKRQRSTFELFGTIRVLRGTYDLYGKRFVINKGNFIFEGGPEYNPNLELEASHVFRAANTEKKILKLLVSGKALNPNIKFTLDDGEISEGNAIAYLVLGRSLDELTHGERSTLAEESGFSASSAASSILTSLVANQVSKIIGNKLNLDVIEFKGEENWQQATFVIGKYLTNDLFFSYQKEFNSSRTNEIDPVQITLEYEINRNLFLQLTRGSEKNTGFDLIFKLQK